MQSNVIKFYFYFIAVISFISCGNQEKTGLINDQSEEKTEQTTKVPKKKDQKTKNIKLNQNAEKYFTDLAKELDLTPDQLNSLKEIRLKYNRRRQTTKTKSPNDTDALKELKKRENKEFRQVLKPALYKQKLEFDRSRNK